MATKERVQQLFDTAMSEISKGNFDEVKSTSNGMIYKLGCVEIEFDYGYDCVPEITAEMSVKFFTPNVDELAVESLHERDREKMREYWKNWYETKIKQYTEELNKYYK